jgi:hypothetical protein
MVGWIRAIGAWGDMGGDSNTAKVDRNLGGFMLGTDKALDDTWRAGMAAGYTRSNLNAHDRNSDAKVDSYHLAGYLNSQFDALAVRLGAAYSWHSIETKRDVSVGSYNDRLKADYDARSAQVFGEVGYAINAAALPSNRLPGWPTSITTATPARKKGEWAPEGRRRSGHHLLDPRRAHRQVGDPGQRQPADATRGHRLAARLRRHQT